MKNAADSLPEAEAASALAEVATAAALLVAPYLREVARSAPAVDLKLDIHDPVTVHDKHVEGVLRAFLGEVVPGSRVLGEEMGEGDEDILERSPAASGSNAAIRHDSLRLVSGLGPRVRWIVDPIDGTANFAAGLTYFGTSVGVELDGNIVAGVISVPFNFDVFVADSTNAWHLNEATGQQSPLRSAGPKTESQAVLASYYPGVWTLNHDPVKAMAHERSLMKTYRAFRRPGAAAVDLAMVAAGWIGVSMAVTLKPWDVAAGIHMVKVAGGDVLNLDLGTGLPEGLRPAVVASVGTLRASTARAILREVDHEVRSRKNG